MIAAAAFSWFSSCMAISKPLLVVGKEHLSPAHVHMHFQKLNTYFQYNQKFRLFKTVKWIYLLEEIKQSNNSDLRTLKNCTFWGWGVGEWEETK